MKIKWNKNITDLPVEILDILFEHCGDISNKVHLAQTHPYLGQAFAYHSRKAFERVSSDTKISLSSWRFILTVCGSNIKRIHRNHQRNVDDEAELVNLIALHCSQLEKVKLNFGTESVACVKSLIFRKQGSLRAISLFLNCTASKISSQMLDEIPEVPLLERLHIFNISVDNYDHILKFENLVKLKIGCCSTHDCKCRNFTPHVDILALCAPLRKLRVLALTGVRIIHSEEKDIPQPVVLLEELSIRRCDIWMREFPVCFNLKIMAFQDNEFDSHEAVHRFIFSQRESLESLSYDCRRLPGYNEEFLELIRVCQKVRYFKLPVQRFQFDLHLVRQTVGILRENGVTPNNPLVLVVNDNAKYKFLQHWLTFIPNSELIRPTIAFRQDM